MKPFDSIERFLLILFALGATVAVGGFPVPARAAPPAVRSSLAAAPPGLLAAVAHNEAAAAAHAPRYRLDAGCTRLP